MVLTAPERFSPFTVKYEQYESRQLTELYRKNPCNAYIANMFYQVSARKRRNSKYGC